MFKRLLLILFATVFLTTNVYSHSCPVLYPDLVAMLEESTLPQEKKDEAKALMDEGWALHLKMTEDEEGMHFEALDILFEALDILESE
tara:strand:- start:951 stop:1214 length:264 start_codon:yes stop_codon:yes gene_type:complete